MNISKRTLALFYYALTWQGGSGMFNEKMSAAILRLIPLGELQKQFNSGSWVDIAVELDQIGKPNKKNKKRQKVRNEI